MLQPIRILLVDDDPQVRRGLRMRLGLDPGIEIVGEADDGLAGVQAATNLRPDVVLLDLRLPGLDGFAACRRIRSEGIAVVILSLDDGPGVPERCLAAGAAAFVSKQDRTETLLRTIRTALGRLECECEWEAKG